MANIEELKNKGNEAFKSKDFEKAKQFYGEALSLKPSKDTAAVLLANRAACHLKLDEYKECEIDCKDSLSYVSDSVKALFRLATAQYHLGKLTDCIPTTKKLLQLEPANVEGQQLMRKAREQLTKQESEQTGMTKTLATIQLSDHKSVENGIKALIDLCKDDVYHALEFARKGGISIVATLLSQEEYRNSEKYVDANVLVLKLLALLTNHPQLIAQHIDYVTIPSKDSVFDLLVKSNDVHKLSLHGLARLCVLQAASDKLVRPLIVTLMNILKHIPASPALNSYDAEGSSEIALTLSDGVVRELLEGFKAVLACKDVETYTMACDIFSAFVSDLPNYYDFYKAPDHRSESLEDRKKRLHKQAIFKFRSKKHADMASRCDFFDLFAEHVDDEAYFVKSNAIACVGKMIKSLDDEETVKYLLKPLLPNPPELDEAKGEAKTESELMAILAPAIPICRRRAALAAALFVTHPELGSWALQQDGGTAQIILLIGTKDYRCMEIAAEVLCLAAGVESASHLLSTLVENNVIHSLLYSSFPTVRAAAASVLTKLSLKAKALSQSSEEVSQILNAVTGVLKTSANGLVEKDKGDHKKGLVSFSSYDNTAVSKADSHTAVTAESKAASSKAASATSVSLSSVERAIEVVAAIVGKTFVKEEIVHGSSRVASLIADLASLEVDPRSTAAFGLAHILASLTVTNRELKALALAEKEITVEQYEQMQELQRIKAKDEDGTVVEERKEDPDNDTAELCNLRIKRIVANDGIKALLRLVEKGSSKTKETACKALRQMLVEHSVRGAFIQQGGLKACCNVASDNDMENAGRFEAAHAIAKSLITTNPNILSEHLRLTSIRPLILLCKEVDATYLQQFEALLALTNILSCGDAEKERFVSEKGVNSAHYLMFSQNLMIRRAATELLCNMSDHEALWKVLRVPEKVKLWMALSEDWDPEDDSRNEESLKEAFLTARAAAGTLAITANDAEVAAAMKQEDCAKTVCSLLATGHLDLVHRTLVMIQALLRSEVEGMAMHLLQGGVVQAMNVVLKCGQENLVFLAKECAQELSAAIRDK